MTASTLFVNVGTVLRLLIRVHKSYLVNKNKISTIICIGDRTYNIEFKTSNKVARMSRNKYKEIKDILI